MQFSVFYNKWGNVKGDMEKMYLKEIDDEKIVKANQDSLSNGIRPDGVEMQPYKPLTLQIKRQTGGYISPSGLIALKDTGSWYKNAFVNTDESRNAKEIQNRDSTLTGDLVERFGNSILDVPDSQVDVIMEDARPRFISSVKKALGL